MNTEYFDNLAAANEALNAEQIKALPTKAEVLATLGRSDLGMPDLIVDEPLGDLEVVFRPSKTWADGIDGEVELHDEGQNELLLTEQELAELVGGQVAGVVRCKLCERKAGEVTVTGSREWGYRCKGGCESQSSLLTALNRQKRLMPKPILRLTAPGKQLQWVTTGKGQATVEYAMTRREHSRRKSVRRQQAASRRANRV